MENNSSSQSQPSYSSRWLTALIILAVGSIAGYWYYTQQLKAETLKFAFSSAHYFEEPDVFYGGKGLRFDIEKTDTRMLRVYVPDEELDMPKYLLVEDGELDFLGFVKKDQLFIPLQLFQIHNDRPGRQQGPVTDCKTYLEIASTSDTILVLVDKKHILRGTRTGPNQFVIPFCETTRQHQFEALGLHGASAASKNAAPVPYATLGIGDGLAGTSSKNYRLRYSGDTVRLSAVYGSPLTYSTPGTGQTDLIPEKKAEIGLTKVTLTLPRQMSSPWVYVDDKRFKDFKLNATRNQITFQTRTSDKLLRVRVGDNNCECQASGYPRRSILELAGACDCRDVQVNVNLDPGLDRYRNKIRVYIDGQLTDMELPAAGKPIIFPVRKTGRDQYVELKLVMVDDSGRAGLIDVCSFSVPTELTTSTLTPPCHCAQCPANIKVSGR